MASHSVRTFELRLGCAWLRLGCGLFPSVSHCGAGVYSQACLHYESHLFTLRNLNVDPYIVSVMLILLSYAAKFRRSLRYTAAFTTTAIVVAALKVCADISKNKNKVKF